MPAFVDELNVQIGREFAAHQQYVAIAAHYDALGMPATARFFYRQALEERGHAMMMVRHLLDRRESLALPALSAPTNRFDGLAEPVALALVQERQVTACIDALVRLAQGAGDQDGADFLAWFVHEQVEEEESMGDLLDAVRAAGDDRAAIEAYASAHLPHDEEDAPLQAGA